MAENQLVQSLRDELVQLDYPVNLVYNNQDTTIKTLWKTKVISTKPGKSVLEETLKAQGKKAPERSKPDLLILNKQRRVEIVYETKDTPNLTESDIQQGVIYGQKLGAKLVIITNGMDAIWVNPQHEVAGTMVTLDGQSIKQRSMRYDEVDTVLQQLSMTNSTVKSSSQQERSVELLARTVWQQIFASARVAKEQDVLLTFSELILWKIICEKKVLALPFTMDAVLNMPKGTRIPYYKNTVREEIKRLYPNSLNGFALNASDTHEDVFEQVLKEFASFGSISKLDVDLKSQMYEIFLESSPKIKTLGQFFTPRVICKALVKMARVKLSDHIHDPACGTGGFLVEAAKELLHHAPFGQMHITGEEVDRSVHLMAMSNVFISGIEEDYGTISASFVRSKDTGVGSLRTIKSGAYNLIFANPPYVRTGIQSLKKNLSPDLKVRSGMLQGFFLEKIVRELAPEARAFVVLPSGILINEYDRSIRKWILQECHIEGIISLPSRLFRNSERKTYVLILKRKKPGEGTQTYPVFSFIAKSVGFTLDTKRERSFDNDVVNELVPQWLAWDRPTRQAPTSAKSHLIPILDILNEPANRMLAEAYFPEAKLKQIGSYSLEEEFNEPELRAEMEENFGRVSELMSTYMALIKSDNETGDAGNE